MPHVISRLLWSALQLGSGIVGYLCFLVWAPWHSAEAIADVPQGIAAQMPPGCPAVVNSHGSYSCFEYGTISANRRGYHIATAILIVSTGTYMLISLAGRGIWDTKGSRPNKSLERTREG
jgi:hypothetical protein